MASCSTLPVALLVLLVTPQTDQTAIGSVLIAKLAFRSPQQHNYKTMLGCCVSICCMLACLSACSSWRAGAIGPQHVPCSFTARVGACGHAGSMSGNTACSCKSMQPPVTTINAARLRCVVLVPCLPCTLLQGHSPPYQPPICHVASPFFLGSLLQDITAAAN